MNLGVPAESAKQIATFLVGYGLLTEDQLVHATNASNEGGKGLMDTIIEFGFIDEQVITKALSETYELDIVNISDEGSIDLSALNSLPKKFMVGNRVIPIRSTDAEIDVAISEPSALNLVSGIRLLTDKKVNAYIASLAKLTNF